MRLLLQRLCAQKWVPVVWTLLTITGLCLPGSSLPGDGAVFDIPDLDKLVHLVLFGGIVVLWGIYYALQPRQWTKRQWYRLVILLAILSTVLGIVLEYVQFYFIPQRSFDRGDIVADMAGAVGGMGWLVLYYSRRLVKS